MKTRYSDKLVELVEMMILGSNNPNKTPNNNKITY